MCGRRAKTADAQKGNMIHVVPKHQSTIYETNMETNMDTEFKCERCKPGHDFQSKQLIQSLQQPKKLIKQLKRLLEVRKKQIHNASD